MEAIQSLPFARRRLRRAQLVMLLIFLASLGVCVVPFWKLLASPMAIVLAFGAAICTSAWAGFIQGILIRSFARRTKRTAEAAGYRLCPECGYDASRGEMVETDAGAPTITCSECGTPFDPDATAALWRIYLG